ncbi:hypothetical protein SUGI_0079410 [Cryptomeria japonica]|nr:hypothetical protein SUGI_0079410 [Cryptomeria japonica]
MDYQISLHCRVIPNYIHNEEMISIPLGDSTVEQSKASGDAEFRALQSAIEPITSVRSSGDCNGQQLSESTTNKSYEDQELSKGANGFQIAEEITLFSTNSFRTFSHMPRPLQSNSSLENSAGESLVLYSFSFQNPQSLHVWAVVACLSRVSCNIESLPIKMCVHFETVRMEYFDRVRVNYFFVPWIAGMLLRLGLPSSIAPENVHPAVCCIFMIPIAVLELKIYGQFVHQGKEISGSSCKPFHPFVRNRKFHDSPYRNKSRLEGNCILLLYCGINSLRGCVHNPLPEIVLRYHRFQKNMPSVLSVYCSSKLGQRGVRSNIRILRYILQDAAFSLTFLVFGLDNENGFLPRQPTEVFNDLGGMCIPNYDNVSGRTKICREREASHCSYIGLRFLFGLHGNDINSCTVNCCEHGSG